VSGVRGGSSGVYRRDPATGRTQQLIHRPGICGGPSCVACEVEQEIAERNEQ
jgi:hypothetical protein